MEEFFAMAEKNFHPQIVLFDVKVYYTWKINKTKKNFFGFIYVDITQ